MAIITISRGTYSGGKELAEKIADKLGYRCVSQEFLVEASQEYHVPQKELFHILNDRPGFFEKMTMDRSHLIAVIRAALCQQVRDEDVVYHGRAGHLLIKGIPHILRTRVIAGMEFRVKGPMAQYGYTEKESLDHIAKLDKERVQWSKSFFGADTRDPSLYDLVMNIDRMGIDNACEVVCAAASLDRFRKSDESQKRMDEFIHRSELEASKSSANREGEHRSIEECLRLVKKERPLSAQMELEMRDMFYADLRFMHPVVKVTLGFADRRLSFLDVLGGYPPFESRAAKRGVVESANQRLEYILSELDKLGIDVEDKERRFSHRAGQFRTAE